MGLFLINFTEGLATIYIIMIIIRSLLHWLKEDVIYKYRGFFNLVSKLTDPLLAKISRVFPVLHSRIDFTPLIAIIAVLIAKSIVVFIINMFFFRAPVI